MRGRYGCRRWGVWCAAAALAAVAACAGPADVSEGASEAPPTDGEVTLFDFTQGVQGWTGNPRVTNLQATAEGLSFTCTGEDPWIEGPPVKAMPLGDRVLLTIRMRSTADRSGEVFYGPTFEPGASRQFQIEPDGAWHEYSVMIPPQKAGTRLRIDPAGYDGDVTVAWIKARALRPLAQLELTAPAHADLSDAPFELTAGPLTLKHGGVLWDGFALYVDGAEMAAAHDDAAIVTIENGEARPIPLRDAAFSLTREGEGLRTEATVQDAGGATWKLTRVFTPGDETIEVVTSLTVDQAREIVHLPWLTLFPGLGVYGEEKTQAMLPGVEYLENEPSSSEADLRGEQAIRRIVDDYKLTFPMMALSHGGRYIGLIWDRTDHPAPVFDSPDRIFNSGAHVMALWEPGVGEYRLENEVNAFRAMPLEARKTYTRTVTLVGGPEETMAGVARRYVALRGLPDLPAFDGDVQDAIRLLAAGWMDSAGHQDGTWRHAVWGSSFPPQPAADAPYFMLWLAAHTDDAALAQRLEAAAQRGLERLPEGSLTPTVGHVARPAAPLVFGSVERYANEIAESARRQLGEFDDEGIVRYRPRRGEPDYGETHWEDHANGLTAGPLGAILEAAAFAGDAELRERGLELLDRLTEVYAGTVPRGAQTWEMPLHTPDILGAGRLVRCYVLGYLLSGEERFLEQARYWAWTGVPMVYLDPPVPEPVGVYATIGVIGATNWVAPNWIGQPVQWCGLVYRTALHDLAQIDGEHGALWAQIAKGITLSGLQQTFPLDDAERCGLLPDFFHIRPQVSDGPAISPGTVQASLAEVYGLPRVYDLVRLANGALVHAPGTVTPGDADATHAHIEAWPQAPYWVRIVGVDAPTEALWNGAPVKEAAYDPGRRALTLKVSGSGELLLR